MSLWIRTHAIGVITDMFGGKRVTVVIEMRLFHTRAREADSVGMLIFGPVASHIEYFTRTARGNDMMEGYKAAVKNALQNWVEGGNNGDNWMKWFSQHLFTP